MGDKVGEGGTAPEREELVRHVDFSVDSNQSRTSNCVQLDSTNEARGRPR